MLYIFLRKNFKLGIKLKGDTNGMEYIWRTWAVTK